MNPKTNIPLPTELSHMLWFFIFWGRNISHFFTSTTGCGRFFIYSYDKVCNFNYNFVFNTTSCDAGHNNMQTHTKSVTAHTYSTVSGGVGVKYCHSDSYRFGFNGMEADNELKGSGNSYDFGARIYDARIGRLLSIDPLFSAFPSESNYIFAGNSPILYIDVDGQFKLEYSEEQLRDWGVTEQQLQSFVNILNNIQSLVESNENAMQALINTTGLSRDEILKDLKNDDDGPVIRFMEGYGSSAGIERMDLGVEIIKNLTNENINIAEQAFGIALVILDEYAHIGDKRTNNALSTGDSEFPETNRPGKQNFPWSPVNHRGEDPSVFGFGLKFLTKESGVVDFEIATDNHIKEGRNYPGTENIPAGFDRSAAGKELLKKEQ